MRCIQKLFSIHSSYSKSTVANNFPALLRTQWWKATCYRTFMLLSQKILTKKLHFSGLQNAQTVLLTHGDSIEHVCDKFKICATSSSNITAGIFNEQDKIYGVQFHPEVDLTLEGKKMLNNFLFEIARFTPSFTILSRKEECIRYIREKVGNNKVLVSNILWILS